MERERKGTVIVVDDDAMVLDTTAAILEEAGFCALPCSNAADALELIRRDEVDAVLTDIKMPGISGIELLDRINALHPEIPVLLLTGHADLENSIEAVKKGAFDYLLKPYKLEQLVNAVAKAVSHRRFQQKEARYRQLLEELNLQIETLTSERSMNLMALTVADRVRNPATVIGLACRRLLERAELPEAVREGIRMIAGEAARLEAIVADFHLVLKDRESLFAPGDLNAVVRDVAAVTEKEAEHRGVAVETALAERPLLMNMEKVLVKQALLHVARNAVEATSPGGAVRLATSASGEDVVVEVKDAGRGIPPGELGKVFDPFSTTKEHRFGMGLPLVKRIVAEHLGALTVESVPERGTTVRITFPARWREAQDRKPPPG